MLSKEQIAALPDGEVVWLAATDDFEGHAPWRTTASPALPRFLAYGEWTPFRTEVEAQVCHAQRLAAWARSEAKRLIKVAQAAEKLAWRAARADRRVA